MTLPELNWNTAAVKDAKLTVKLEGERPDGWKDSFTTTVALLGGGNWGEIKLKGDTVRVSELSRGDEDRVRHFLEGVVQQANARHQPDEPEDDEAPREDKDEDEDGEDEDDSQMTASFRDFADDHPTAGD